VLDTKPDPRNPRVVRTIEAEELASKAGYSRPHTIHCGPGGIFMFALGGANGNDGPGGVALLDHETFDVIGAWWAGAVTASSAGAPRAGTRTAPATPTSTCTAPVRAGRRGCSRSRVVLGDRKRIRNVPESGWRTR